MSDLKLAISLVVNGAAQASAALKSLGEQAKGLSLAFREGVRLGIDEELTKAGAGFEDLMKRASAAREALGMRPHADIRAEIERVKAAYETLKESGVASASEVAQAYLHAQSRIAELKNQTSGLADAFDKVKGSAAAFMSGFAFDAAAVKKSFDFEYATVQIAKLANLDDAGLAKVRADLRELARVIPIPAEGLAKIGEAAAQLNLPVEDYRAFIELVAKSASAFNIPVDAAGKAFGKLKNNFRLSLSELGLVADSFNLLADTIANVEEGELLNFTERLSSTAKALGLTAQQAAAMGATLLSTGRQPEVAARAMQSFLATLQTAEGQSPKFKKALEAIGLDAKKLADDIRNNPQKAIVDFLTTLSRLDSKTQTLTVNTLFGDNFFDEVLALIQNLDRYQETLDKVSDKTRYAGNVNSAFAQDAATGAVQWQLAKQSMEEFMRTVGDALAPLAKVLIQAFRDLADVVSWLAREFPTLTAIVAVGGPLAAGFGALKVAIGAVNLMLARMIEGILGAGTAANVAFAAIKRALAVLGAAFIGWEIGTHLRNEFTEVRLFGIAMVRGLLLALEHLKYGFGRGWEGIKYSAVLMWEGIRFAFDKAVAVIKARFGDLVASIGRGMASIPGLKDEAKDVIAYGEALKKQAAATEDWASRMARIRAEHEKTVAAMKADYEREVRLIRTTTDAMANDEIMAEAAKKAKAMAIPVGKDMAAGVAQGIQEGSPAAEQTMRDLVRRLEAAARDEAETRSPSKVYARFGGDLIDGWVDGMVERMEEREAEITSLVRRTAELMRDSAMDVVSVAPQGRMRSGSSGQFVAREVQEYVEAVEKARGPIAAGFAAYVQTAGKAAVNIRHAMERAFKGMEDALVNFVKTGKLNFKSLVDSILSDIIRIQIQESITKPLAAAMSGLNFGKLFGFAHGGVPGGASISAWRNQIVDRPTFFAFARGGVMGEAGPEAIMPLRRGPDGRLGVDAYGISGAQVTVNIIEAPGSPQAGSAMTRQGADGETLIDILVDRIRGTFAREIMRGEGLAIPIEGRYGLNPAAGAWR